MFAKVATAGGVYWGCSMALPSGSHGYHSTGPRDFRDLGHPALLLTAHSALFKRQVNKFDLRDLAELFVLE